MKTPFFHVCLGVMACLQRAATGMVYGNIKLELQSSCNSSGDLREALEVQLMPLLLKEAAAQDTSTIVTDNPLGRLFLPSHTSTIGMNTFPYKTFSITSASNQRYLRETIVDDPRNNGTESLFALLSEEGEQEEKVGPEESKSPMVAVFDCPVFRNCPCNDCPGHWCLVFCGYQGSQRALSSIEVPHLKEKPLVVEKDVGNEDGNGKKNVFLRRSSPSTSKPRYCHTLDEALSKLEDSCLAGATLFHCSIEY